MSLNISDEVIKAAVREEVNAGIVKALGNPDVIIRDAIHEMTNKYVDERGNFCKKDSWRSKPYFDWLAEETVRSCVKEEIQKYVNEHKEELAEAIRNQLNDIDFRNKVSAAFLQSLVDSSKNSWLMPITVSFEKPKEY